MRRDWLKTGLLGQRLQVQGRARRRAAPAIRFSLLAGENKASRFYSGVRCAVIAWRQRARAAFELWILASMNTEGEPETAKRRISK